MNVVDTKYWLTDLKAAIGSYQRTYLVAFAKRNGWVTLPFAVTASLVNRYGIQRAAKIYGLVDLYIRQLKARPLYSLRHRDPLIQLWRILTGEHD